ncbi:MAG: DNA primase [Kiritimatiellae bacterium]|nr:DNA primase [Kiritimatiellia bacterium]
MSGGITDSVLEEIKVRTSLADLVSSYGVQVRHAGSSLKACCPFHNEKTPSFNINESKGFYHCFGCGESGDAIKFVQKMEGLEFVDAVKKLAGLCGVTIEERADPEAGRRKRLYALMAELTQFYHRCLNSLKDAGIAREYLAGRGLDGGVCDDWLIGYAPVGLAPIRKWAAKYNFTMEEVEAAGVVKPPDRPGDSPYHRFGGRLMFPIKDRQGRVVAFSGRQLVENKNSGKYVNSPETVIFRKSNVLFGFDRASGAIARAPHREVICCEGQIDTIRLHICGFKTAVGSQGTAFTEEHAQMVRRVADAAVLMYDDDKAGHKATIRVAAMLLGMEMPVRVVALPGGDDPDSFLRAHPASDLQALIDGAESIVSFQCRVERAKEVNAESIDAVSRVSRAVLQTIAACPSAILRASLVDEAAKLLNLPVAALTEELAKTKPVEFRSVRASERRQHPPAEAPDAPGAETFDEPCEPEEDDVLEPPSQVVPPPELEFAFMAFMMANENDVAIDGLVGAYLPPWTFAHDFTRRFTEVWRTEAATGEDRLAEFADALDKEERPWFDRVLLESGASQASGLGPAEIMQDFIRALWCDKFKRERGNLPAVGCDEARLFKLSCDIKRLPRLSWGSVTDLIKDHIMRQEGETQK